MHSHSLCRNNLLNTYFSPGEWLYQYLQATSELDFYLHTATFILLLHSTAFYLHVLYENAMQSDEGREKQFCSVAYLLQCFPFWSCTVCVEIVSGSVAGVSTIMNTLSSQCLGTLMTFPTTEPSAWICCWDSFLGKVDKSW